MFGVNLKLEIHNSLNREGKMKEMLPVSSNIMLMELWGSSSEKDKGDIMTAIVFWHKLVNLEEFRDHFTNDKKKGIKYEELDARISQYTVDCNNKARDLMDIYKKIRRSVGPDKNILIPMRRLRKHYPDL